MAELTYTMIATLGGQAQVVTFALDYLLAQDFQIHDVFVLHLMPSTDIPRVKRALAQLGAAFTDNRYRGQFCRLHLLPVRYASQRLDDIQDEAAANAAWSAVYTLIADMKGQGKHLHVCVSGGRRMLALLAMSAAMLHFDHNDRLWHMYTPQDFLERARNGAIMHARPEDGVRLIRVPLAPWGAYFSGLHALAQLSPLEAVAAQTRQLDAEEAQRCQMTVEHLTPRQLDALRAFAAGHNPQKVAELMSVTVKTVHTHKTEILSECRNAWALPEDARLTYHFLREKFGRYFECE